MRSTPGKPGKPRWRRRSSRRMSASLISANRWWARTLSNSSALRTNPQSLIVFSRLSIASSRNRALFSANVTSALSTFSLISAIVPFLSRFSNRRLYTAALQPADDLAREPVPLPKHPLRPTNKPWHNVCQCWRSLLPTLYPSWVTSPMHTAFELRAL